MTTIYFSPSVIAFYTSDVNANSIPNDSLEIDFDLYINLLNEQSSGKIISKSQSGLPIVIDPPISQDVPSVVTKAQGKAALIRSGFWQGVIDYVASIEDATQKALAEVALNDTTNWQRSSPFLNAAAQALGLTDQQLDQFFIDASKIEL